MSQPLNCLLLHGAPYWVWRARLVLSCVPLLVHQDVIFCVLYNIVAKVLLTVGQHWTALSWSPSDSLLCRRFPNYTVCMVLIHILSCCVVWYEPLWPSPYCLSMICHPVTFCVVVLCLSIVYLLTHCISVCFVVLCQPVFTVFSLWCVSR